MQPSPLLGMSRQAGALLVAGLLTVLAPTPSPAQINPMLQITTIRYGPGAPVLLTFADTGTRSTNYLVQFSPGLGAAALWTNVTEAMITDQGDGSYGAALPDMASAQGFFRIMGLGHPGSVSASFSTPDLRVSEGGMITPTITFSSPYTGILRYTLGGTAASGDYQALSGEVFVNGLTASIPITLTDNDVLGQLKFLTIFLEADPGYELGATSVSTIFIEENDAAWNGSFLAEDEAALGFIMRVEEVNNLVAATLRSDRFGFFPTNDLPVNLVFANDTFSAQVADIPLPPSSTLIQSPLQLTFTLGATNGVLDQSVSSTFIQGPASLILAVPSHPHLNTTNRGVFQLQKPPSAPSTNEVELVDIP